MGRSPQILFPALKSHSRQDYGLTGRKNVTKKKGRRYITADEFLGGKLRPAAFLVSEETGLENLRPSQCPLISTTRGHLILDIPGDGGPRSGSSSRGHRFGRTLEDSKPRHTKSPTVLPSHSHGAGPGGWHEQIAPHRAL
jgi:hypothetical protein